MRDGGVTVSQSYTVHKLTLKLHHPDAAEMARVRLELDRGATKKDTAVAHHVGTPSRLTRLLKKHFGPDEGKGRGEALAAALGGGDDGEK